MLPSSHPVPINGVQTSAAPSAQLLADAFSEFISASAHLESSYKSLQEEVACLNAELGKRNSALTKSLAENNRIRVALQRMLDSMPCGVLVVDAAGRIVTINPECRRLLQLGENTVHSIDELAARSTLNLSPLAAECDGEVERELRIYGDREERWLAVRNRDLSNEGDGNGRLQRMWILRDISNEKQAEKEKESARRTAVLAEITTILAHEIRNPLASMELFAGLIEQDRENSAQWISNLRAGIRSLSGTVNNVLNLNNPNALSVAPVNLVACVESGVEFVRPIAEQDEVSLTFGAAHDEIIIPGNENAIQQIVLNIVCNAIRHTASGGEVAVTVREASRNSRSVALVGIEDTGCGISSDIMDEIFKPGFSGNGDSPGLGLAVCKRLMERLGGSIHVSSKLAFGTTFQLEFPVL